MVGVQDSVDAGNCLEDTGKYLQELLARLGLPPGTSTVAANALLADHDDPYTRRAARAAAVRYRESKVAGKSPDNYPSYGNKVADKGPDNYPSYGDKVAVKGPDNYPSYGDKVAAVRDLAREPLHAVFAGAASGEEPQPSPTPGPDPGPDPSPSPDPSPTPAPTPDPCEDYCVGGSASYAKVRG